MTPHLMLALQAAGLWSGLLILLLLVLSGVVVSGRRRHLVSLGDGGHAELQAATRAFGNCAEYAAPGMAALTLLAVLGAEPWMVHAVGATLFVGRVAHALGLLLQTGPSLGRVLDVDRPAERGGRAYRLRPVTTKPSRMLRCEDGSAISGHD